uniref:Uncharacterized protein n=1 Tax=Magallana gigas TaxID=29159 RepID=A0A8W8M5Y0_MAGGI
MNILDDAVFGQEVEESHQREIPCDGGAQSTSNKVTLNSNSFSPLRINTQSRTKGSGPFNSHASSPLHSSVHQSPYSLSYLSSSFTQRHTSIMELLHITH